MIANYEMVAIVGFAPADSEPSQAGSVDLYVDSSH